VRAFETRDVETVTKHVYFDSIRRSLSDQIVAAYLRRSGVQMSPLVQGIAGSAVAIADPIVGKVISPEALSEFLSLQNGFRRRYGFPLPVLHDQDPAPKDRPHIGREIARTLRATSRIAALTRLELAALGWPSVADFVGIGLRWRSGPG
jgi:hypothetical protein